MKAARTPCINPHCKRTGRADEFPAEMICRRCFQTLPEAVRKEHRGYWREIRKWERRIARTGDELKITRMRSIVGRLSWRLAMHWDREIRPRMLSPEKPLGLDAFLEEIGM